MSDLRFWNAVDAASVMQLSPGKWRFYPGHPLAIVTLANKREAAGRSMRWLQSKPRPCGKYSGGWEWSVSAWAKSGDACNKQESCRPKGKPPGIGRLSGASSRIRLIRGRLLLEKHTPGPCVPGCELSGVVCSSPD